MKVGGVRPAELPLGAQPRLARPAPRPGALLSRSAAAGAAPHPRRPHPDKSLSRFQHHGRHACSLALLRASSCALTRCQDIHTHIHTHRHKPTLLFSTEMPKLLRAGAARHPAGLGWPSAPSLTLSRQLTFSVGYTTFPQRAHWGFIVAVPGGGGWAAEAAAVGSEEPL